MEPDALVRRMQEILPRIQFEHGTSRDAYPTVYIARDDVAVLMRTLRDHPDLRFAFLAELTAVDYWPREPRFELVYLLVSIEHRHRVRVKVRLQGEDPRVADLTGVWPAANWLEREVWDLFGIVFDGHPDPRRLLMPEDWEGYPLRKDYPVQVNMPARISEPMQVSVEEFRQNLEDDRLTRRG